MTTRELVPLPRQPDGVAWPTQTWPRAEPEVIDAARLECLVEATFVEPDPPQLGHTHALLVVQGGRLVVERYGQRVPDEIEQLAGIEAGPITPRTPHLSWSMAKSVLHAAVGRLVLAGRIDPKAPAPVPAWAGDDRAAITWDDLLAMRAGLTWTEEYYDFDEAVPEVITMLYGQGRVDMAGFAESFDLVATPGSPEAFTYSSGTSNIVSAALGQVLGDGEAAMRAFLAEDVLGPIGMTSAEPGFDETGTFVASSYLEATARDWARFGLWALRDGVWEGERRLPEGWIDHGRRPRSWSEDRWHGSHWWAVEDRWGSFMADGFEGQRIICVPALDLLVVRTGRSHGDLKPTLEGHLFDLISCFEPG